jgi:Domain of unknown function (DUF3883)
MTNLQSLLEVQAKELTRELKRIPGIKTKTKFTPWNSETGGFGTSVASWTKNISVAMYLDYAPGRDRPRFWVGFSAKSKVALDDLLARLQDQPETKLKGDDFTKDKNGGWRYSRPRQTALTRPYAEYWPANEFFYGFYDWGGHATERSLKLNIHHAYIFIEKTVKSVPINGPEPPQPPDLSEIAQRLAEEAAKRRAAETAAMEAAEKYFLGNGFTVTDRTKDNCGWDLDAKNGTTELKVEVKGLSGNGVTVQVTPNEYEAMAGDPADPNYRICIVTNARSRKRKLRVFEKANDEWVCAGREVLKVETLMVAKLTVVAKR